MNLHFLRYALTCLVAFLFSDLVKCQVVINEVCPSNISIIQNSNTKFDDWIELYNSGSNPVDLTGYGLSDDATSPFLFSFPSEILPAGSRMLVFASDSNCNTLVNHYELAVDGSSIWKYTPGSSSLDTNWRNLSYDDRYWPSGNGGIGFNDGDDGTTIPLTVSVMMRKSFIADPSKILNAFFMMDYDDGFVAYLNGVEIARSNINGSHRPHWDDLAIEPHEAGMYQGLLPDSFYINPAFLKSILKNGTNILSVETHDVYAVQTDMSSKPFLVFGMKDAALTYATSPSWFTAPPPEHYNAKFKLKNLGESVYLFDPSGNIIDQVTYPTIENDNAYARNPDGSTNWCLQKNPSPLTSNNQSSCYSGYATSPIFSVQSGYYNVSQSISLITSMPGGEIRYTTNGNTPDSSSTLYSTPINVDSTTTIRAAVFASGFLRSPDVTNSYLINQDIHLPVFSITTDSVNLWDENTGIYVLGPNADTVSPYFGANFWQDWTKPASIEYFDKSHTRLFSFNADIQIYGNYSRHKKQKSFEIGLSDKYGVDEVNYPFISDKPYVTKFDEIILRNSGTDWNVVHFRDALMQRLMKNTYSGYIGAEPVAMFLNGAYWGVYMFNEKHNQNWIEANYGFKKDEINFLVEVGNEINIGEGSDNSFWDMYDYAVNESPTTGQYYEKINSLLDLQNYADYFIAETYYDNGDWIGDWTNNIKLWRPKKDNGKWKYILIDTDYGFGLKGSVNDNRLGMARAPVEKSYSSDIFNSVLNNPTFKNYFINRYADLINTIYLPGNVDEVMKQFRDSMAFDMIAHFARWGHDTVIWQSNISDMMAFVNQRPSIARGFINSEFNLQGEVLLTINTMPAGSGRIEISTITPTTYPWTGTYFNGNPVTITAIPNPGFTFDHWSSAIIPSADLNQRVTYNFNASDSIVAYFSGSSAPAQITISEFNYNSSSELRVDDWIELKNYGTFSLDISGWKLKDEDDHNMYVFPTGTAILPGGYLVVPEDSDDFKEFFPSVTNHVGELGFSLSNNGEELRIFDYKDSLYQSFFYNDQLPWPVKADGEGFTCELTDPFGDVNNGNNWYSGCFGGSPGRAYSTSLMTQIPVSGDTTFCAESFAELNAPAISIYTYQWAFNNNILPNEVSDSLIINQEGSYNVLIDAEGCTTSSSQVNIVKFPQQPIPTVTSDTRCGEGFMELTASSSDSIFWSNVHGGPSIATGDTLFIPSISQTTTYYAHTGRVCPSEDVLVVATVKEGPCDESISIVPNPSTGQKVIIKSDELTDGEAILTITDVTGRRIKEIKLSISRKGEAAEINLSDLKFGIYFFTINQEEKSFNAQFIKL